MQVSERMAHAPPAALAHHYREDVVAPVVKQHRERALQPPVSNIPAPPQKRMDTLNDRVLAGEPKSSIATEDEETEDTDLENKMLDRALKDLEDFKYKYRKPEDGKVLNESRPKESSTLM